MSRALCVLVTPTMPVVIAGAAICNPKDFSDLATGYKLAFSRAVEQLYPHVSMPEFDTMPDDQYNAICRKRQNNKETREIIWHFFLAELPKALTV